MSQTTGYFQYYDATGRIPLVKGCDISHFQYPVNFTTMKTQGDYVTMKCGGQYTANFTARYIKVTANGSSVNTRTVFNELQVYDSGGTERAAGKTVTASAVPLTGALSLFVDGNLSTYTVIGDLTQWIKVDLATSYNLTWLLLQMYYTDGRTFHNKKIEYSIDNINWTTLFDTAQAGELPEKNGGMILFNYAGMSADVQCTLANITAARTAGLKVGLYYFKNPNYYDSSNGWLNNVAHAELEAQQFYNYIIAATGNSSDMGDIFPMLDFENQDGNIYPAMTNDGCYDYIEAFINKFKALSGRQIILYTALYCIDNLGTSAAQSIYHSTKGGIGAKCPLNLSAISTTYPNTDFTAFGTFTINKWINWQFNYVNALGATWGCYSSDIDLDVLEGALDTMMPPSTPTGFTATSGDTAITLNWSASPDSDIQYFNIYKNGVYLDFVPSTTLTYTITGLTNGTNYNFNIQGVDYWENGLKSITANSTPAIIAGSISSNIICEAIVTGTLGNILKVKRSGMNNAATKMFQFGDTLYILTGTEYLKYDGTTCSTVTGYVPLLAIGVPPLGGTGTVVGDGQGRIFEQLNVLTGSKHETFSPNGTSADFFILEQNVTSIDYVKKNGILLTLTTDYTVDLTLGKVHFVVIPVTGNPSNIDIGWTKGAGQRTLITNCRFEMDYSGQTDSRVFLWGNTALKNRRFWSGLANGVPTAEYFEANSYDDLGTGEFAISDIVKQLDRQKIFFELGGGTMYSYYAATTDVIGNTLVTFPVFELNENIGNQAFGQVQIIDDKPFTLNKGIYSWLPTTVRDQTNASLISQRVQSSLNEVDLSLGITYNWQEQKEYWLNIGNIVWIYNYVNDTWYKYDDISASCFLVINELMYFGSEGSIQKFTEGNRGDNGQPINVYWEMGFYDFGVNWRVKFMNKAWVGINSSYRTMLDLVYVTNNDGASEKQTIQFNILTFKHINFEHFSFKVTQNPQPYALDIAAQQFVYFKYILSKLDVETAVTVLSLTLLARVGGKIQ
jgi:GH25 family lysozyme M1 (1,4-beta-N-acetylmuramidase)